MAEVISPRGLPDEVRPEHVQDATARELYGAALPAPGSPPATWYEGPYAAAAALRRWADKLRGNVAGQLSIADQAALMRDLRGAASVLDGASR